MAAQAQQTITVKTNNNNKEKFLLNNRVILDLSNRRPVVRNKTQSTTYNTSDTIVMYVSSLYDEDAIKVTNAANNNNGIIYDLSGRKVSRPVKGIYIKEGKKSIQK